MDSLGSAYKILLVEDDENIREIFGELLAGEGFDCTLAEDGLAAVERLKSTTFDLLITDFRMPRMDGSQLLNWCRINRYFFPVIFITANVELLPKEQIAIQDCCATLLQKPVSLAKMLAAIEGAKKKAHTSSALVSREGKLDYETSVG